MICNILSPTSLSMPSKVNPVQNRTEESLAVLQTKAWVIAFTSMWAEKEQGRVAPSLYQPWHSSALPPQCCSRIHFVPGITKPDLSQLKHCYTSQHCSNCVVDMVKHTGGEEENGEETHE